MNPYLAALLNIIPGLGLYKLGDKEQAKTSFVMFCLSVIVPLIGWIMIPWAFYIPAKKSYDLAKAQNLSKEIPYCGVVC